MIIIDDGHKNGMGSMSTSQTDSLGAPSVGMAHARLHICKSSSGSHWMATSVESRKEERQRSWGRLKTMNTWSK